MSTTRLTTNTGFCAWIRGAAAVAAVATLCLAAGGAAHAADTSKGMSAPEMKGHSSANSMEMHHSMMKGMKDMESMSSSGDTDRDFAMMMKKHHQSALDMAEVELKLGKDAKLRGMAKDIIKSQKKEIKKFDEWLAKHNEPMSQPMAKPK